MPKYGLYARKSDDDRKVTEKSIGEQVAECRRVADAGGLDVARVWEESRSARKPDNRPLWKELVAEVKAGRIDAILCWHINRLVRNMQEGGELVQLFVDGRLREVRTPHGTHREGDNILPLVIEAATATQYSIDLKRVVERSMEAKFQDGGWNGLAPQGYRNLRDPGNAKQGVVGRDPERFDLVRKAWELMLTGSHTVQLVADTLNDAWGYRTRRTAKGGGRPLSLTGMYQVFRNPFYAGFAHRRGELVRGRHEAMVSPGEFERVQRILDRRSFQAVRTHAHPYTGLMRCGYCGQQVTAERKRLRNGGLWDTYHCSDSYHRCTRRGMSLAGVEATIAEAVSRVSVDPETAAIALEELLRTLEGDGDDAAGLLARHAAARADCRARLDKLTDMWLGGLITDRARYLELEARETEALNGLTVAVEKARRENEHARENARRASEYVSFAKERFLAAPTEKRRELAKALGNGFAFYGREKRIAIEADPLLLEFVSFARSTRRPLEPHEPGSWSAREAPRVGALLSGRPARSLTEPLLTGADCGDAAELTSTLLEALRGPLFPDLGPGKLGAGT